MFSYKSKRKENKKLLFFTLHFGSKHLAGQIIIKIMINTITPTQDKKANTTQDQMEFER